ncbi:4-alpha-glucanotransferase [Parvibaculum lavamentivorans DS-1]|uniref:4-alpha-glucanotransferase n=1 Tax=Parvibaculum lavamentivorans (strain DS-1 / DSM 13023 / NCIMB 13966) TaxID=402881 RepID=A7HQI5_PARL1|nr:4-alpha-glucanotransferase [Parvibaculum lavamentivorans]ABS62168.1 4-alpha-glucanotransferase [Parvibaculum lavamentivorans DS-1]
MSRIVSLAQAAGIQVEWTDAAGRRQRVSEDALSAILAALGLPADSSSAIADSCNRLEERASGETSFLSGDQGSVIRLQGRYGGAKRARLVLEDGSARDVVLEDGQDGAMLPAIGQPGYHRLLLDDHEVQLAVAPPHCYPIGEATGGRRVWGPAIQIAALRDARETSYGDYSSLADAARAFSERGADAMAISPVHALFPADTSRYSPYAPSSRLFLNVFYADPALIGGAMPSAPRAALIDWPAAIPERLGALRAAYDGRDAGVKEAVSAYVAEAGEELRRHALFDALHAHFFRQSGAGGWQDWPIEYRNPSDRAVATFAAAHEDEVGFYIFLQWLAEKGLDEAQRSARQAGMAIGLIADLAVGMDAGGSHAWSRPEELLTGLSIGAPPDPLGPDGQNWGITGFSPQALQRTGFDAFIATIRAALRHAGGIRIDHALGLRRLWVVPSGASSADGAYLTYPLDDMLRLLALESQRAKAIVIGEDLGTVPEGLREEMGRKEMLGMRVLWFERGADEAFLPPKEWQGKAAAMTGTHDLPTVAGWWSGRDIDWTWNLKRKADAPSEAEHREGRERERTKFWAAMRDAGVTDAAMPEPDDANPVLDAALAFVSETPCPIAILPMEDIVGLVEQPNLPGTMNEHPNWCRRMPGPTRDLLDQPDIARRIAILKSKRAR